LLAASALLLVSSANAQRIAPEMKLLDFMVGEWEGNGWAEFGEGHTQTFTMKQKVTRRGGGVIIIEGLGTYGFPGRSDRIVIHQVFNVVGFDWKEKVFRLRAYQDDEGLFDAIPTVSENMLVWGYREGFLKRLVRNTIRLNGKKQWWEVGELSSDNGKSRRKVFEMTLDKVAQ
jgi:hypothetical protein